MKLSSTDGCQIELHDFGGNGPDLVICHATGFNGRAYEPLAQGLVDHFHVWAVDFRGHGASSVPEDGESSWDGMRDDLMTVAEWIRAETGSSDPLVAVGHSMGGAAILLAALAQPDLFRAAYLYEPIVLPSEFITSSRPNPMAAPARRRREIFASKAEVLQRYASRPPLGALRADVLVAYIDGGFEDLPDGTVRITCRGEYEARTFESAGKVSFEEVAGLPLPLTVGYGLGDKDNMVATFAPVLAETVANGTLIGYEHLGHFGPLEAPPVVAADVVKALA